jgi:hypothetical protein
LGDWYPRSTYSLTGKASPNDPEIVIIIIIVIGEAKLREHIGGIIAQFRLISIKIENPINCPKLEIHSRKLYSTHIVQVHTTERKFPMKLRYLFIVNTIVALIFAAGLLLAPKTMLNLFGLNVGAAVKANASINLVAQLLGAALVVPGLLSFFAVGLQEMGARRSIAVSLLVFDIVGFGVSFFVGMLPKVMSVAGWSIVMLFMLFAVGYAYFLFMKSSEI